MASQKFNTKRITNSFCTKSEGMSGKPFFRPDTPGYRALGTIEGVRAGLERMAGVRTNETPTQGFDVKTVADMLWGAEKRIRADGVDSHLFSHDVEHLADLAVDVMRLIHASDDREYGRQMEQRLMAFTRNSIYPALPIATIRFFSRLGKDREKNGDTRGKISAGERIAEVIEMAQARQTRDAEWKEVAREGYRALDRLGLEMEEA